MNDLISRQAAINAILAVTGNSSVRELYEHVQEHGLSEMWSGGVNAAIDIIIAVPSAQPKTEERTAESVQNVPNDDLISRKAAIDKLKREEKIFYSPTGLRYLIGAIRDLPSVQPEQKKGRWIETNIKGLDYVYCSECQDTYYPVPIDVDWYYCPHCGAKMEDEQE